MKINSKGLVSNHWWSPDDGLRNEPYLITPIKLNKRLVAATPFKTSTGIWLIVSLSVNAAPPEAKSAAKTFTNKPGRNNGEDDSCHKLK